MSVLVVSADPAQLEPVTDALISSGFSVEVVRSGADALFQDRLSRHSVVLIDDALADMTALSLIQAVRERSDIPIVVLTASWLEDAIVALLEAGADQCVAKPAWLGELTARVRAAARRRPDRKDEPAVVDIDNVHLDPSGHVVTVSGREVRLTRKEFDLLHLLMVNAGQTISRRLMIERVWGPGATDRKTLDTHIRRIRAKIESNPSLPSRIVTVRKVGYRYQRPYVP